MKLTREVIRYNQVDSQGDVFLPECFKDEGVEVPVTINFDPTRVVGKATLRSTETGVVADLDSEALDRSGFSNKPYEVALGFIANAYRILDNKTGRRFDSVGFTNVAIVRPEDKA